MKIAAVTLSVAYFFIGNDMTGIRERFGDFAYALDTMNAGVILFVFSFEGGTVSKILSSKPLQTLGRASMYIFLLHYPFVIYRPIFGKLLGLPPSAEFAICEALFILIATFGFSCLTLKISRKKRR